MQVTSEVSFKQFELENNIITEDTIFHYDEEENQKILQSRLWDNTPDYFKHVKMSAIALIKITTHAKSGDSHEVMGLMNGKVYGDTLIIMDAYPVPSESSPEGPANRAQMYVSKYMELEKVVGRLEGVIGWYHSHPSYGCYLGGIDISTQQLYQKTGPMVAVVIDPVRTMSTGKVDIQAFRTYPEEFVSHREDWIYPMKYYALEISYYKSALDAKVLDMLWNKYWIQTILSKKNIAENRDEICNKICNLSHQVIEILAKKNKSAEEREENKDISLETKETEKTNDDKTLSLAQLMRKDKSEFQDLIRFSREKSKSLLEELIKVHLF